MEDKLNIYQFIENTKVEGPGLRDCIYLQGCTIRCEGCTSPQTWDKDNGTLYSVDFIVDKVLNNDKIEGVTFSGGEPFNQAKNLSKIAKIFQENNLSVVVFTGYELEDILKSNDKYYNELLNFTDLLIDGPFILSKKDFSRPLVGSSNQKFHFLSDKYCEEDLTKNRNFEVRLLPNGEVLVLGVGNKEEVKKLFL